MRNSLNDDPTQFKEVGLSVVFFRMTEEYRAEVVKRTLTERDQVSAEVRATLDRWVDARVSVKGFRNASIAPTPLLQEPVTASVRYNDDLAGAVLRVWAESLQPLRDLVDAHFRDESLLDGEPDYATNTILIGHFDPRWKDAIDHLIELRTEFSDDDLLLMSCYTSGVMLTDEEDSNSPTISAVENGEDCSTKKADAEALDSPVTVSDEPQGGFGPILDTLRVLPHDAPEWDPLINFSKAIALIRKEKLADVRKAAELDSQLLAIATRHASLLKFFEWNAEEKLAQRRHPWTDIEEAREVIDRLASLLDEYAPVHHMAAVRSKEAKLAPRRSELQERIDDILSQFERLEVHAPLAKPQVEGPTLHGPAFNPLPPEEHYVAVEAKLAMLRADVERLSAENQSLNSDNRHLTEQASELESDLNESRNLAEMWRRSYQDVKSEEANVGGSLPDFESVVQVVQLAKENLADCITFQLNSKSDIEVPFDNPRQVWDALEWLATTYYQARMGENGEPDLNLSLRHACGWRYTSNQSDVTVGKYKDYYETHVGHRSHELREHIGTGNGYHRGTIRIAFAWEAVEKKVIVGYIGRHQRTDAS